MIVLVCATSAARAAEAFTVEDIEVRDAVVAGRVRHLLVDRVDAEVAELRDELARLSHATDPDRVREVQRALAALQQRRRALLGQPV